ncbi:MAG TPA: protein tyrosine phosphatase [Selenomonadales bacterium]|nr:protein tyrosine phosphatase [Selenomonadales bacterium]
MLVTTGGEPIKLLFICSRNKWRSLTAEKIFDGINGYEARSAGTEDRARVRVTAGLIGWADIIFAMERKHVRRLQERFRDSLSGKRVVCLHIPDDYRFMDNELIDLLVASVSEHIDLPETMFE